MILQSDVFAHLALRRAPASSQPPTLAPPSSPWTPHPHPQASHKAPKGTPKDKQDPPLDHVWPPKWDKQNIWFYCSKTYNSAQKWARANDGQTFCSHFFLCFSPSALRFLHLVVFFLLGCVLRRFLGPCGLPRAFSGSPLQARMYLLLQ